MKNLNLNQSQSLAISHKDGPMMVIAGPGSGKTTVITHRVKYLIENYKIHPSEILVITFAKVAAEEMKKRYENITGSTSGVMFATFHSLFFRMLRAHTKIDIKDVLRDEERHDILKKISLEIGIDIEDEELFGSITFEMSLIKNELIDINFYHSKNIPSGDFRSLVNMYEEYKDNHNKLDFDDMLSKCYNMLVNNKGILKIWQNKYKYLMIDEFQDINKAQYSIVKLLVSDLKNVYIVGDDDQSIYKFRGARPDFLLNFSEDFDASNTVLDINYRSTNEIIELSNNVIMKNKVRYNKRIKGTGRSGQTPILLTSEDVNSEALDIAKKIQTLIKTEDIGEICIVYRTNIQSRAFIDAFTNLNIPYQVKDEIPLIYEHFIFKDVSSYMKAALDRNDNISVERIINKPSRYINKGVISSVKDRSTPLIDSLFNSIHLKTWQHGRLDELVFYLDSIKKRNPYDAFKYIRKAVGYDDYIKEYAVFKKVNTRGLFEVLEELSESSKNFETLDAYIDHANTVIQESKNKSQDKSERARGVTLSTMHGVKGAEFDIVFVSSCVEGVIPHERSRTEEEIEEERRLLYVAVTRPRKLLYLSTLKTRYEEEAKLTRFLKDVIGTA